MLAISGVIFFAQMPFYIMSHRGFIEPSRQRRFEFNIRSESVVAKFFVVSLIGAIGGNVFFSLFPYYVNRKFSVESDAIGTLYFVSNLVSAGANAVAPGVSRKMGTLKTIAATIALATPFYMMMPMAHNFMWLSALYIGRLCFRTMADPLIGSLFMRLLHEEEKATANSLRMMALQGSNIVAPWLGGQLMERTSLDCPAYLGTGLYVVYAVSYYFLLRKEEEKESELTRPIIS